MTVIADAANARNEQSTTEFLYQIRVLFEGTYTLRVVEDFFDLFLKIGPYLLVSIAINIAAARYLRKKTLRFSPQGELWGIVSAALLGLVSPLPTYAAIPLGVSLLATGVPFSAVIAFVISSPLVNPSILFLTATQLGMEMAVARTVTAFLLGVLGGVLAKYVFARLYTPGTAIVADHTKSPKSLLQEIYGNVAYVGKTFSVAILLSAIVKALVPPEAITGLLGGNARTGTLVAIGLGVPFYTCGGAAIPFVQTLMELGMTKGAALAFFIAGPATKLETLYAFHQVLGVKVLVFYLALTLIFSFIAGVLYGLY